MPNFALLDTGQPEIAHLLTAMLQAREAVGRRSWSHPQEPTGEDWWADVLADPRARKRNWRIDKAIRQDSPGSLTSCAVSFSLRAASATGGLLLVATS
jgi:hypothetical protein